MKRRFGTRNQGRSRERATACTRLTPMFETLEPRALLAVTTAIQSGEWDDPATWSAGVPNDTMRAVIASGVAVTLTGTDHAAEEIVVHGTLDVAEQVSSDFDDSTTVNGADFLRWQNGFGLSSPSGSHGLGDADNDLDVDHVDLADWRQSYGSAVATTTRTLTADWIHVNSGGVFQIGTASNPFDQGEFVVTLTGTDTQADHTVETTTGSLQITDNDGFLMAAGGGRLQFFGENTLTFTKLSQTATSGTNQITVENVIERNYDGTTSAASDGALNWKVGDQIVIASSSQDYADQEVRTITALNDLGDGRTQLTLDAPLINRHYGEIESYGSGANVREIDMRAEVALLNRNVRIQGLASQDTDNQFGDRARFNAGTGQGIGGHIMIMGTAGQITVDSVQLEGMGQTGQLGRYPFHWHLAGDRTGDVLRGVSITNSNNRGVTVHGTHNLLIQDVLLHDIHGHGFFMEDAVETGNTYLSNIAFGIHKVGRSDAVGDNNPDLNDPFIVDTHDHVGQNPTRFLSSAGYWMTNPDNTWVGNVSAGSEGTGYWFLFPDSAIGLSANDSQYNGVRPDRVNLGQFDYNSSHSSPIGLNFDRGSDIEGPVGATLKANFDGDAHNPSAEPQINYYTAYKHTTGIYHRARTGNFHESRFADNFTSTFITFTQRITNALYVGHSTGNSDPNQIVTGHTFYDGANTLDGTHFAGFDASNSHMFRTNGVAIRHTHFVMRNTSFEDDGSANNLSYSDVNGGTSSYNPVGKSMPSVLYDEDGTLSSHVGGQAGSTVVPDHPFFYDSGDSKPAGWNARISDDLYAVFRMRSPSGQNPTFRVTTPDGDQAQNSPGTGQFAGTNTLMKKDAGDYTVDFPQGVNTASNGFDILYFNVNGPQNGSTVVRFQNMGNTFSVENRPFVNSLSAVRNATQTSWTRLGDDLYVNFFTVQSESDRVNFVPGAVQDPAVLWVDNAPLTGDSDANVGLSVTTVNGSVTGDASRGSVGQVAITGNTQYGIITPGTIALDTQYRNTEYSLQVDYFIPNGTTLDGPDLLYVQINFNGVNSGSAGFQGDEDAGEGWNTIVLTGTIPSNANNVRPAVILADGGIGSAPPNGNGSGVAFYLDNINFTVGLAASSASSVAELVGVQTSSSDTSFASTDDVDNDLFFQPGADAIGLAASRSDDQDAGHWLWPVHRLESANTSSSTGVADRDIAFANLETSADEFSGAALFLDRDFEEEWLEESLGDSNLE
ncbi:MAG: G8 domain-containing protein [Planctomycetota bacterium]